MRLTARGFGAIGITLVTLVTIAVLGESALGPLAAVGVSCLLCAVLVMLIFGKKITHLVLFPVDRAHRNEEILLNWEARKTGVLPRRVRMHTTQGSGAEMRVHGFSRKQLHAMSWRNSRRGTLSVLGIDETVRDPLHLVKRSLRYHVQASMTVWPARWELSRALLTASWDNPEYESAERGQDAGVRSLRHYVAGDDPRHVHWSASAHHGELIVAERNKDTDPRVLVVLDTQVTPVVLDFAADAACSLIAMLSQQGAQWVLAAGESVAQSSKRRPLDNHGGDLEEAFDVLSAVRTGEFSLQNTLDTYQRMMRVVITPRALGDLSLDKGDVVVWLHAGDTSGAPDTDSHLVVLWDVRFSFQDAWESAVSPDSN